MPQCPIAGDANVFLGWHSSKKAWGSIVSSRIGMKFGRIVLQVNMPRLKDVDFWQHGILSRWRPWRPPAVCCCICSRDRRLPANPPSACYIIGSVYTLLKFLIHNAFHNFVLIFSLALHAAAMKMKWFPHCCCCILHCFDAVVWPVTILL